MLTSSEFADLEEMGLFTFSILSYSIFYRTSFSEDDSPSENISNPAFPESGGAFSG